MVLRPDEEDERAHSRRYTEEGINVVALDRNNRGLYRARPERRVATNRFTTPHESGTSRLPSLMFGVLVVVALGLLIARFVGST